MINGFPRIPIISGIDARRAPSKRAWPGQTDNPCPLSSRVNRKFLAELSDAKRSRLEAPRLRAAAREVNRKCETSCGHKNLVSLVLGNRLDPQKRSWNLEKLCIVFEVWSEKILIRTEQVSET